MRVHHPPNSPLTSVIPSWSECAEGVLRSLKASPECVGRERLDCSQRNWGTSEVCEVCVCAKGRGRGQDCRKLLEAALSLQCMTHTLPQLCFTLIYVTTFNSGPAARVFKHLCTRALKCVCPCRCAPTSHIATQLHVPVTGTLAGMCRLPSGSGKPLQCSGALCACAWWERAVCCSLQLHAHSTIDSCHCIHLI